MVAIPNITTGEVYYTQRAAWWAIGIVFAAILPILMCIICAVYCYRKKARKVDPGWKIALPRSRAGSRTTLRNLGSDGSEVDSDTLKKSRSYEKVYRTHEPLEGKPNIEFPAKKWDLDEEDITSSDGGSEFPQTKVSKDVNLIGNDTPQQPPHNERQLGRRTQRGMPQQPDTIQEENYLAQPVESTSGFSYSSGYALDQRRPTGGVRVIPSNKFFSDNSGSPVSSGSPILTQNVGLPSPPLNYRSSEV